MKTVFTLTSAESRRLIAKAVIKMPEFQKAWKKAYVLLAGGTSNAFIAQELLGRDGISPEQCTVGISTDGVLCVTPEKSRKMFPNTFYKGKAVEKPFEEAFKDFHEETILIKGANAFDLNGNVGIVTSGFDGGTVPRFIGYVTSNGLKVIIPVGLEKLIPSVPEACRMVGARSIDISMGADFGMYCLSNVILVSEIEALKLLFGVETHLICSGGVGGNQGAVTLASIGDKDAVEKLVKFLEKEVKGEPAVGGNKGNCEICQYKRCRYNGLKEEALPDWLKK